MLTGRSCNRIEEEPRISLPGLFFLGSSERLSAKNTLLALNRRGYERDAEAMRRLTEKTVRLTERTVRLTVVNTVVATLALIAAVISLRR